MKFEKINENKLKIELTAEDMQSMGLTVQEMEWNNPKTRRAFWEIFNKAKRETGFDALAEKTIISVQDQPQNGGCVILITKTADKSSVEIDSLTGFATSDIFNNSFPITLEVADEKNCSLTLVMLDLDGLMRVNRDFGHETGDSVIKEVAEILQKIDAEHQTYRYSGDQFALIFPNCEKEQAFLIMEEARKKIAEAPECSRTSCTVSAGIATYPEDGERDVELIRKADGAMYRAKAAGANRIALAKEEKLVTKTAHYTVEQLKKLEKLSDGAGISEAALMREALDELLKKYDK